MSIQAARVPLAVITTTRATGRLAVRGPAADVLWRPVYRVEIDRDLAIAERFGVMSIPRVLIFRGGTEVARLDGLIREDELRAAFERATRA